MSRRRFSIAGGMRRTGILACLFERARCSGLEQRPTRPEGQAGCLSYARRRRAPGFVLLEVILAITIMTFAIGTALRSFTQSLAAVRLMEVKSKAQFFAQQLLDEYELQPPAEGEYEGGFGDDHWEYTYRVEIQYEEQDYDSASRSSDIDRYVPMRLLSIEIVFDNGVQEPYVAATLKSAILGFEKYSQEARRQFQEY